MQPKPLILALTLGLVATACSDLQCPKDSIRVAEDRCHACEPGTRPKDNKCVSITDSGTGEDSGIAPEQPMTVSPPALAADGGTPVPRAENVPTLGGFATIGEPRKNSTASTIQDDGFELGATLCNPDGRCLTGSFAP